MLGVARPGPCGRRVRLATTWATEREVDYAAREENVRDACRRYAEEGVAGYVGPVGLDEVRPPC